MIGEGNIFIHKFSLFYHYTTIMLLWLLIVNYC